MEMIANAAKMCVCVFHAELFLSGDVAGGVPAARISGLVER
jgi:hypothetical protein